MLPLQKAALLQAERGDCIGTTEGASGNVKPRTRSWKVLLDALLDATPCEAPTKQALASRVPEVTHRELPAGRGFLRVVDGGKSSPKAPTPIAPTPAPVAAVASFVEPELPRWTQLDLLSWKPRSRQLGLWGDE
jgi:hypothetical protein